MHYARNLMYLAQDNIVALAVHTFPVPHWKTSKHLKAIGGNTCVNKIRFGTIHRRSSQILSPSPPPVPIPGPRPLLGRSVYVGRKFAQRTGHWSQHLVMDFRPEMKRNGLRCEVLGL